MFDSLLNGMTSWTGLLGTIGLTLASYLAKRYVIPFLEVGRRRRYAEYIAHIADDVTDELKSKYPEKIWMNHLDEAINRLMAIVGISPEIARRVIKASASRK